MNNKIFNKQYQIVVVAAGTGGHIFPGLAIAEYLRECNVSVCWVGTELGMENNIVPKRGFEICHVDFSGVRGKGVMALLMLPWRLTKAVFQAIGIINKLKVQLILVMGGYLSFPMAIAAKVCNKKLVLHEQNFLAGTANKWISHIANVRLCGFEGALPNSVFVGNPVREQFFNIPSAKIRAEEKEKNNLPIQIGVVGGSLGAQKLNNIVPLAISELIKTTNNFSINIIHQCGNKHIELTCQNYTKQNFPSNIKYEVVGFIDDMPKFMANCDLLICRAGAQTVSEVSASGTCALFVPFPFAIDDHQSFNAKYLSDKNCALLIAEKDLSAEVLGQIIKNNNREQLAEIGEKARQYAINNSARRCGNICLELIKTQTQKKVSEVNNET